jgi:hypothetical protein
MKAIFISLLTGFCLSCCNSHNTAKKEVTIADTGTINISKNQSIDIDSIQYPAADPAVHISFDKKNSEKIIYGILKGNDQPIKIYIDINFGDTLHAIIEPSEQDANIRLNQIIYPGGESEGPFGRDQKFALKKMGFYQLIISNDLMAEGKTKTAFNLHLSVY